GFEQAILAPVVCGQADAMGCAVVLKGQSPVWKVEVGPAEEEPGAVVQRDLDLRSGKPAQNQQQPQTGLHPAFGGGLGEPDGAPKPGDSSMPRMSIGPFRQFCNTNQAPV